MSITSAKTGATGISLALENNFMEPIATALVGASGVNTITFNDIPQNYKHLQIRAICRDTSAFTEANVYLFVNNDYTSSYAYHFLYGTGTAAAAGSGTSATIGLAFRGVSGGGTANAFGAAVMDVLDYKDTNKNKTFRVLTGHDQSGSGFVFLWSTLWPYTAPVTSLTFTPSVGNFAQYSRISLYGIKG